MTNTNDWVEFDLQDLKTHPEGQGDIEVELKDRRQVEIMCSRPAGMLGYTSGRGTQDLIPENIRRWRYVQR
jgi:hypothetical protein